MGNLGDDRALAARQPVFGDALVLMEDPDRTCIQPFTNQHTLARIRIGHGVAVPAVAERAVLRDQAMADVAGVVIGMAAERGKVLARPPFQRNLAGGAMHAPVGLIAPRERLPVEIAKAVELDAGPETRLDVPDGRLDLALGKKRVMQTLVMVEYKFSLSRTLSIL